MPTQERTDSGGGASSALWPESDKSGIPPVFITEVRLIRQALESIAASLQNGKAEPQDKTMVALSALAQFGDEIPTWDELAKHTGIPRSTLNRNPAVRKARDEMARRVRSARDTFSTQHDAWDELDNE